MNSPTVRVLLIDDDRDDYELTRALLAEVPAAPFHLDWACDYDAGLLALGRNEHDVCLLDYRLGARNGLELLREARGRGCNTTVIMMTGQSEADLDNAALLSGVAGFLKKDRLDALQLDRAIRFSMKQSRHAGDLEHLVQQRTEELAAVNASLRLADRRKNEFLAMLAHELRNPLAPIRNALLIIQRSGDAAAAASAIAMMERQVGHMVRLVDDLLDVSRISSGKFDLRRDRIELASVIDHALEVARPLCERAQQQLSVSVPAGSIHLDADAARLTQVITNLLNNASKFGRQGGRITLCVERDGDLAVIRVSDDGEGIAPDQLSRIFDMFVQVHSSLELSRGGLGLGLALAKTLVEMHGGSLEAQSGGLGLGSEFVVRLPALVEPPRAMREPRPADAAAAPVVRRRILVVDDNVDAAESLALLLQLAGHDVAAVHDGPAALDAVAKLQPDVVLLDIGLPGMSGFAAARHIREMPAGKHAFLVATTGWGQDEDRRKSADAGFDAHLVKPLDPCALARVLAELAQPGAGAAPTGARGN